MVNNKLFKLMVLNAAVVLLLFVTASALSGYVENARENSISSRLNSVENMIYELETLDAGGEEFLSVVYGINPLISAVNQDLKTYLSQNKISKSFYEVHDEKLISLTVLYIKTLKQVLSDKIVIQFFCSYDIAACDYEGFVLSYLSMKYSGDIFVSHFDAESTHPLVRMIREKYGVNEFPFMIIGDESFNGFMSAEELEGLVLEHVNNSFKA